MGPEALARWRPHLEAAAQEGKTLAQYARERGMSRHSLYTAKQILGRSNGAARKPRAPALRPVGKSQLIPVRLATSGTASISVRLPNGIEIGVPGLSGTAVLELVRGCAGLKCSG